MCVCVCLSLSLLRMEEPLRVCVCLKRMAEPLRVCVCVCVCVSRERQSHCTCVCVPERPRASGVKGNQWDELKTAGKKLKRRFWKKYKSY